MFLREASSWVSVSTVFFLRSCFSEFFAMLILTTGLGMQSTVTDSIILLNSLSTLALKSASIW